MMELFQLTESDHSCPILLGGVPAGKAQAVFEEFVWRSIEEELNLDISTTIIARVYGHSMIEADIFDNDLLIISTSKKPIHGDICVVRLNGEITCKYWSDVQKMGYSRRNLRLVPANGKFKPIKIEPSDEVDIIGVVDHVIQSKRNR